MALDNIVSAAKKYGKSLGRLVKTPNEGLIDWEKGFDFCCFETDAMLFQRALKDGIEKIRERCQ